MIRDSAFLKLTEETTQLPSITDVESWSTEQLIQHLQAKFPDDLNRAALDILREQEIRGRAFLKQTKEDLTSYGMKGGPASIIASYVKDLKRMYHLRLIPLFSRSPFNF